MEGPKVFISYSWSNPVHEQWVLKLATDLVENGVNVILDKWDLREGHDAIAFMEKMVTDPEVKKVVIVSDKIYSEKADGRMGGVGTETQIISKEIYERQEQDKFVVVVAEKDEKGKPYLPTYYKSRIFIDLFEPDRYIENFDRLLRWIYDKPLYVKPEIGTKPSFINNENSITLGTTAKFKRAIDGLRNDKSFASGALDEYFGTFSENLERFRIKKTEGEFDDLIIKSITEFLPYRNEAIQLVIALSQYASSDENIQKVHVFLENLIPFMYRPNDEGSYSQWSFDNFRFIIHELFLYIVAILIKHERFAQTNLLMEQGYYLAGRSEYGRDTMISFVVFHEEVRSLLHRNKRLNLKRLSLRADLLSQRCAGTGIEFRHLMQADFVLYLRSQIEATADDSHRWWWPETLLYVGYRHTKPFEIFARAGSKKYFEKVKCLLAIQSPQDLEELMHEYKEGKRQAPKWEFESFYPPALLAYDQLAKRP